MRAIASLTLSFGLVSIPVKLYSATEAAAAVRFKLMSSGGARMRQQYVADVEPDAVEERVSAGPPPPAKATRPITRDALVEDDTPAPTSLAKGREQRIGAGDDEAAAGPAELHTHAGGFERQDMVKGYEFEKGKFVLFSPAELKALQEGARDSIDIVSFIPAGAVDPVYYDKAYLLAPDKRGEKTYSLLLAALQRSGRCALGKWAWRSKQYVVEVRPADGGLVLQQLFYAEEVRSIAALSPKLVDVGEAELELALRLIEQGAQDAYDPTQFVDEEKQRILAAVEQKVAGREIVATAQVHGTSGQVIDLMAALRASLQPPGVPDKKSAVTASRRAASASRKLPAAKKAVPASGSKTRIRK